MHTHHVTLYAEGGLTVPDNMLTVCSACHRNLHNGNLHLQKNQHRYRWTDKAGRPLRVFRPQPPPMNCSTRFRVFPMQKTCRFPSRVATLMTREADVECCHVITRRMMELGAVLILVAGAASVFARRQELATAAVFTPLPANPDSTPGPLRSWTRTSLQVDGISLGMTSG